jgi:hypothetical protein
MRARAGFRRPESDATERQLCRRIRVDGRERCEDDCLSKEKHPQLGFKQLSVPDLK